MLFLSTVSVDKVVGKLFSIGARSMVVMGLTH